MLRIMTILALAICLLGCDTGVLSGDAVALRTSDTDTIGTPCFLSGVEGELILDASSGLAWRLGPDDIRPVIWPRGFTARHVGSEVQVVDRDGQVVATTGRKVEVPYTRMESGLVFACG